MCVHDLVVQRFACKASAGKVLVCVCVNALVVYAMGETLGRPTIPSGR